MDGPRAAREGELLRLFREERPALIRFLLRGCGDAGTAEDLLQETLLAVWEHRDALDPADRTGMRGYLWRAARNRVVDEIRARQRSRAAATEPAPPPRAPEGPDARVEWEDCLRVVRETVGRLHNRRTRRCLELWLEGLGLEEIAGEMKLGAGAVRGLLQRGRSEVILRASQQLRAPGGGR